jgi:hypothetical protein
VGIELEVNQKHVGTAPTHVLFEIMPQGDFEAESAAAASNS